MTLRQSSLAPVNRLEPFSLPGASRAGIFSGKMVLVEAPDDTMPLHRAATKPLTWQSAFPSIYLIDVVTS
ncbi:MAG TPA: hypothetical protein VHN58_03110 [Croceicoccus sp.]|nr:hypothetical protein [Croceicoccus sp.]